MKQTFNMKRQLSISLRYCYSSKRATQNMLATRSSPTIGINLRGLPLPAVTVSHTKYAGYPQFAHHWYKPTWLTATSSHCLTTLRAKRSAFNSYMRQNAYYRDLKCIFEDSLPSYCYATKANSRTIRSRVQQPASVGKEAD